jgi:hypothetical protein
MQEGCHADEQIEMNFVEITSVAVGAIIIVAVVWNVVRRGAPSDLDHDTEGTFESGDGSN